MKLFLSLILSLTCTGFALLNAQSLAKGEKVPDHRFVVRLGDSTYTTSLAELEGKYVIIDFWRKDCYDCLAAMPDLLALQREFKNRLVVLLVTSNSIEEVNKLFSQFRRKEGTKEWIQAAAELPLVVGDTVFEKLFPYKAVPTQVWITDKRAYYGMAYSTNANRQDITDWTSGIAITLDEMIEREIDLLKPATLLQSAMAPRPLLYSMLLGRIEFGGGARNWTIPLIDSVTGLQEGISFLNTTIVDLYKQAYRSEMGIGPIPDFRIQWNVGKDKLMPRPPRLYPGLNEKSQFFKWASTNTFCYVLKWTSHAEEAFDSIMRIDLDRWFGLNSRISMKRVKCRVLKEVSTSGVPRYRANRANVSENYVATDTEKQLDNVPFSQIHMSILSIADRQKWNMPVLTDIKHKGNSSLHLKADKGFANLPLAELNKQLASYHLRIVEEYRPIKMLIITDPPK